MSVIHSADGCVWAIRHDVSEHVAREVARRFQDEAPNGKRDWTPVHRAAYLSLTGGRLGFVGPAFAFPSELPPAPGVVEIHREERLSSHLDGWLPSEIARGRAPVFGVLQSGCLVSVCFSARSTAHAAAAGVETSAAFRGRGLALRVTAAWANRVRASGRVPLYSASRDNGASLTVARKLGLVPHAYFWSIV